MVIRKTGFERVPVEIPPDLTRAGASTVRTWVWSPATASSTFLDTSKWIKLTGLKSLTGEQLAQVAGAGMPIGEVFAVSTKPVDGFGTSLRPHAHGAVMLHAKGGSTCGESVYRLTLRRKNSTASTSP